MKYQKTTTYERTEVVGNLLVMPGHFNYIFLLKFYCLCYVCQTLCCTDYVWRWVWM